MSLFALSLFSLSLLPLSLFPLTLFALSLFALALLPFVPEAAGELAEVLRRPPAGLGCLGHLVPRHLPGRLGGAAGGAGVDAVRLGGLLADVVG